MECAEMAEVVSNSLWYTTEFDDQSVIVDTLTFKEKGVLTNDVGLVVRTGDNETFYLTITKR